MKIMTMANEQQKFENENTPAILMAWWWVLCIFMVIRSLWRRGQL